MSPSPSKPNIVILGGGTGAELARKLSGKLDASKANITLIDARPYRVHLIAMARIIVTDEGQLEKDAFGPYTNLFINGNGQFVQGRATAVELHKGKQSGDVVLEEGGKRVPFDILVLAPGSKWVGAMQIPDDANEAVELLRKSRESFKRAKNVVIAGAGAVGLEIAGEIKDTYPQTQVTVVHGAKEVSNATYPSKFRKALEKTFVDRGVQFVFGDYIDDFPSEAELQSAGAVTTRNGQKIPADLIVNSTGPLPATDFLSTSSSSFGSDILTKQGHIKVQPTLQLSEHPNVFALGDAIDWQEQKTALKSVNHSAIILHNIPAYMSGKPLKEYKGSAEMIGIVNGREGGMIYLPWLWGIIMGAWFMRLMKSRSLLIPMFRKSIGL